MTDKYNLTLLETSIQLEKLTEPRKWADKIPYLNFPEFVEIKPIPNFSGSMVRFLAQHRDNPKFRVSVYLDCFGLLGAINFSDDPYWEMHPDVDGEPTRFAIGNGKGLVDAIVASLQSQRGKK